MFIENLFSVAAGNGILKAPLFLQSIFTNRDVYNKPHLPQGSIRVCADNLKKSRNYFLRFVFNIIGVEKNDRHVVRDIRIHKNLNKRKISPQ